MKKKIAIMSIIFALMCSLLAIGASAVVLPSNDDELVVNVYSICFKTDNKKYDIPALNSVPSTISKSFVNQYGMRKVLNVNGDEIIYSFELMDGSKMEFMFGSYWFDVAINCPDTYGRFSDNMQALFYTTDRIGLDQDVFLYIDNFGSLCAVVVEYDPSDDMYRHIVEWEVNTSLLCGSIFVYGTDISTSYNDGYKDGYDVGFNDGKTKYEDIPDGEYKYTEDDLLNYYNIGYLAGQDTNGIVNEGISGFFSALGGFFEPFMSIGIGTLTVYSLLGLVVVASLVFVIIKIVKG